MFWNKRIKTTDPNTSQKSKLKPPSDLPHQVGRHLVVNLQKDPDWVWDLKAVVKPVEGGKKSARHFRNSLEENAEAVEVMTNRAIKETNDQGIKILNYDSLDACPELILYEGDFDKDSNAVSLADRGPAKAA